jgi:segregation and condensation protein B
MTEPSETLPDELRLVEALLFASAEPLAPAALARHLPEGTDLPALLDRLRADYEGRGVNLVRVNQRWAFRTSEDLAGRLQIETESQRKLSRAAVETLATIAYHQPVTRAEIEEIRGVALSKGTLDSLLEAGWVRPKGRRRTPGRPVTWGTTDDFLDHFGLESLDALPGLAELKAAGLLDARPAIAALNASGRLADFAAEHEAGEEAADEQAEETGEEIGEESGEEPLAADFGDELVPEDEAPAEDPEDSPEDSPDNSGSAPQHVTPQDAAPENAPPEEESVPEEGVPEESLRDDAVVGGASRGG